jgi:hypothetical protein
MSNTSNSNDVFPDFYPKPEVPEGMERCFPFFLDSQMPPYVQFKTNLCAVLSNETMMARKADGSVHEIGGFFTIRMKSTEVASKSKIADIISPDGNDQPLETN